MSPGSHTSIGSSNGNVTYLSDNDPWAEDERAAQHYRARFIGRAYLAYLRLHLRDEAGFYTEVPSENFSHVHYDEETERGYVCLGGPTGKLLAIYRIDSRQKLKRLRRYPASMSGAFYAPDEGDLEFAKNGSPVDRRLS